MHSSASKSGKDAKLKWRYVTVLLQKLIFKYRNQPYKLLYLRLHLSINHLVTQFQPEHFNWKGKTVLIAEDDDLSRKLLNLYLVPTGLTLLWARNGVEAMELVRDNHHTNLVVLDIQMPLMNGLEVARNLKRDYGHIPVIIQTAYAVPEYIRACDEIGCDDYLTKPFERTKLLQAIQNQLVDANVACEPVIWAIFPTPIFFLWSISGNQP